MSLEYDHCLKKGKIKHFSRGKTLAPKELEAAAADLERAKKTYSDGDYKWTTIQLYYSMFHSARALLYFKNLREHSHFCLIAAMKCLYVDTQQISLSLAKDCNTQKISEKMQTITTDGHTKEVKNCSRLQQPFWKLQKKLLMLMLIDSSH